MDERAQWLERAREFHRRGGPGAVRFRVEALRRLDGAIASRERELLGALRADLGKPELEAWASEIGVVRTDIRHAAHRVARWARTRRRATPWGLMPASSRVRPEPLGVVLIIGPWNYPFQLLFSPLVGALAAGNCACLKPSELAPRVSAAAAGLVREAFDPDHVTVCEGGAETARALTGLRFDHVFFTGSAHVGRQVMRAAAAGPTPVTLELGGKSPCIVCADARISVAARRITWGKFLNAGQTCVAPDHVLAHESVKRRLVSELRAAIREFFGENPQSSPDYGRIVNERHFARLCGYLGQASVAVGGESDASELYIAPTVLMDPEPASAVMREEIFGPILPVIGFDDLGRMLERLRAGPTPLALYLFSEDAAVHDRVLEGTVSGGVCINDVINQITAKELPFGGRGESGMGQYHGRAGFDRFTHHRSVMRRSTRFDPGYAYPPGRVSLEKLKKFYGLLFGR